MGAKFLFFLKLETIPVLPGYASCIKAYITHPGVLPFQCCLMPTPQLLQWGSMAKPNIMAKLSFPHPRQWGKGIPRPTFASDMLGHCSDLRGQAEHLRSISLKIRQNAAGMKVVRVY